jgi:flavin-dependent dehydrogenase
MSTSPESIENLVIGGGPAGSMVAMRLADAVCRVTLLEKERTAHHKVCGEFLSREALEHLHRAGINPEDLGAASIHAVRLSSARRMVKAPLPFAALSLSRRILDDMLLAVAQEKGCQVRRGVLVEKMTADRGEWLVQLRDQRSIRAHTVFLATGKHELHGWERTGGKQCDLVGFKMHCKLDPAHIELLRDVMELFLFQAGYGGLSLIEGDRANLCLVVQRSRLRKLGGWPELLRAVLIENSHLKVRMHGSCPLWQRPLAISSIPYGHLAESCDDIWRVGDQAAVIPSFTGDGISIALHSGSLAAQMYLAGKGATEYHRELRSQLSRGMSLATMLSRAIVSDLGRTLAPRVLSILPNAMQWIASSTRIPERALAVGLAQPSLESAAAGVHSA